MAVSDLNSDNETNLATLENFLRNLSDRLHMILHCGPISYRNIFALSEVEPHLWATLPLSAGIVLPDQDFEFICPTPLSSSTFFGCIAERLDLDESLIPRKDAQSLVIPIQSNPLLAQMWKLDPLPGKTHRSIVFRYLKVDHDFDADEPTPPQSLDIEDGNTTYLECYEAARASEQLVWTRSRERQRQTRHHFLHLYRWVTNAGVLSEKYGMLTAKSLFQMFLTMLFTLERDVASEKQGDASSDVVQIDVLQEIISRRLIDEFFTSEYSMTIRTATGRDLAETITPEGSCAIRAAIGRIHEADRDGFALLTRETGLEDFLNSAHCLVRISSRCWKPRSLDPFTNGMELILVNLQKRFRVAVDEAYGVLVWPFALTEAQQSQQTETELVYVLDVRQIDLYQHEWSHEELISLLEAQLAELPYDRSFVFIEIAHTSAQEVRELIASYATQTTACAANSAPVAPPSNVQRPQTATSIDESSKKPAFLTANRAMSRLQFDPAHENEEYEVGYMDRFLPDTLLWRALSRWKMATEEEDFVPEHRVRQIRRVQDKYVVWDRGGRWDDTGTAPS